MRTVIGSETATSLTRRVDEPVVPAILPVPPVSVLVEEGVTREAPAIVPTCGSSVPVPPRSVLTAGPAVPGPPGVVIGKTGVVIVPPMPVMGVAGVIRLPLNVDVTPGLLIVAARLLIVVGLICTVEFRD